MANVDTLKQNLQTKPAPKDLRTLIKEAAAELSLALPEHMRAERLVRIALTCIRLNPKLADCTPESFLGALFTAAQLGIEPIAGRAYLIPFRNSYKDAGGWHSRLEAQFVIGYRGVAELFYRHEKAIALHWAAVHEKDEFSYALGTEYYLCHRPAKDDRGQAIGFWCMADLGKARPFHYMSLEECMDHGRKHSKTYLKATKDRKEGFAEDSPWNTNPEAMCLKTVLLQLCKVLPLSFELQRALEQDETSHEYRKGVQDMLDTPSTTNWQEPPQREAPEPEKAKDPDDPGEPPPTAAKTGTEPEIPFGR